MHNEPDQPNELHSTGSELNQPQDSTPMEVHHHAHAKGRKKVSDYFWEFLMLFLAVFCGFLAEYQLEHVIEHQREATLMKTLTEDLNTDIRTLVTYSRWRSEVDQDFDSLLFLLSKPNPDQFGFSIYQKTLRSGMRFGLPDINEGTIQQLKNAGGLRLVRKREVVIAINKHYLLVARMRSAYETERLLRVRLAETTADVLDARLTLHPVQNNNSYRLMTNDKAIINRFMNQIRGSMTLHKNLINTLDSARVSTLKLKDLIEQEYHL